MPAIATLVADLNAGTVVGVGAKPDVAQTNVSSTLSGTCRVKNSYVHMNATLTAGNRLSCVAAVMSPTFDGGYIHFEDELRRPWGRWTSTAG